MHTFLSRNAAARKSSGFTLVELLVVIGIIAILAGVALGPITGGIKKAKESGAMQTTRTIALAEFQYANDNDGAYPDGTDSGVIATALVNGNYASDPKLFVISSDVNYVPYTPVAGGTIPKSAISYDFLGLASANNAVAGLNATTPDQAPLVWSDGDPGCVMPTSANQGTAFTPTNGIFGKDGVAVCYHSNNAFFRTPNHATNVTFPPVGEAIFVDNSFDPTSTSGTYVIRPGSIQ